MTNFSSYLLVGLGGFFGAIARFFVNQLGLKLVGVNFPWATVFINISGSFLLGFIVTMAGYRATAHADALRLALAVGFLGAYTTFSTFEFETSTLLTDGKWLYALANVLGSVLFGFIAVRLGIMLARRA